MKKVLKRFFQILVIILFVNEMYYAGVFHIFNPSTAQSVIKEFSSAYYENYFSGASNIRLDKEIESLIPIGESKEQALTVLKEAGFSMSEVSDRKEFEKGSSDEVWYAAKNAMSWFHFYSGDFRIVFHVKNEKVESVKAFIVKG